MRRIRIADTMSATLAAQIITQQLTTARIEQTHEYRVPLDVHLAADPARRRSVVGRFHPADASRLSCQPCPEDGIIQHPENKTHRKVELHKVNPELRVFQRARLIVGVAKCCPARIDVIEFDNPLPYRRRDSLVMPLFNPENASLQRMYEVADLANQLEIQLQRVTICEQDWIPPIARLPAFER